MIKADLHIHTELSDGSYTTEEVVKLAKENGLTHIAITNHDTVKGLKEAIDIGKENGITVIPGLEISAYDYKRNRKVHMLGYGMDLEATHIKKICQRLLNDRNEMTLKQAQIIKDLGYNISIEDVKAYSKNSGVSYKQHIMKVMMDKGYTDEIYPPLYKQLFKNNGPCEMEVEYIDVYDAIDAIIKDNGIPVLAHPGQLKSYELLEELVSKGLVGVEKYHISHTEEDYKTIDKLAKKYNLIITGGSDFHGRYDKKRTIGCCTTPLESVMLLEFKANKDSENAIYMKKYMKDNFEFIGIKSPKRKELQKAYIKELSKEKHIYYDLVKKLWQQDEREFQYIAIDYLIKNKKKLKKEDILLLEHITITKSWWDTVDLIASSLVGELCKKYPELIDEYISKWSIDKNIWLRRVAILFQLKYKENTDTNLLENIISRNNEDKEFFINKAIGWILREYSKTNSQWVKEYISNNKLSVLSVREGSKYIK